ncbi:poly(ADP-ribose) glycohydrolase 1-like [Pistacia vera]|uniref:poly(ADP-ribose) glycohydrolase 1-like n=1 Tax=Pistacia vera TaxID=55513 RepID=UPI001263D12E|nr:poly(ADP-ribose) glycohydrolase 1-like [Pistacia vera]XP_031257442.1 poly(ADP-ribose) glycohydrolase 1-like [Pistacia vera]
MSKGPENSRVNSREVLSVAICDIKSSLFLFESLAPLALNGYTLFFDNVLLLMFQWEGDFVFMAYILGGINKMVLLALASFLLQLPSLLEIHYQNADDFLGKYGIQTRLSNWVHKKQA